MQVVTALSVDRMEASDTTRATTLGTTLDTILDTTRDTIRYCVECHHHCLIISVDQGGRCGMMGGTCGNGGAASPEVVIPARPGETEEEVEEPTIGPSE